MNFVLPKLNSLVLKDLKANADDFRKYIHVVKGHAVVINGVFSIVNLREYIKKECDITLDEDFERLDGILSWMEGKSFTGDYWAELTKEHDVNLLTDGSLEVQSLTYSKKLYWEETMSGITNMLDLLINNLNKQQQSIEILGVPFDSLNKVVSCFKTEAKGKNLLIKPIAQDSHLLYQVHQKEYIFGLIPLDYNSSTDLYAFLDVNQFYEKLAQAILE